MKQIKQGAIKKLMKNILQGIFTMAIILISISFTKMNVFAESLIYNINTTDVAILESDLSGIATVSKSESIITITLTSDVNGMIIFEGPEGTTYILDAAGHTVDGSGQDETIQLSFWNRSNVILKGNGIYQPGNNNAVYEKSGWGKLVVESGTFYAPTSGIKIIRGYVYFELADGYDYYSVNTNNGKLLGTYNRMEKYQYCIFLKEGKLVVTQCNGEIPTFIIDALDTDNGSYIVEVNEVESTLAKPDDTVTVIYNPDTNYIPYRLDVKNKITSKIIDSTLYDNKSSRDFPMPECDISIALSYIFYNKITVQPTAENLTVVTNNPDGVSSYEWYKKSTLGDDVVEGQTSNTYTGPNGDVYCKVTFDNGDIRDSNTVTCGDVSKPIDTDETPTPTETPTQTPTQTEALSITDGANLVYQINSEGTITMRCSGKLEDLASIYVDGIFVDPVNYDTKSGSTIVTLHQDYLDGLNEGSHILTFIYPTGSAEASFSIISGKDQVPKTGENMHAIWLIIILLASGTGAIYVGKNNKIIKN